MQTIALDIGDTLLNRLAPKNIEMPDGSLTYPLFPGVIEALEHLIGEGHKLVIISKINPGDNEKVFGYVRHHNIVPQLIQPKDVYFCHEWDEKGPIAKKINATVIVDDRVEVHNTMSRCEIPHRILFLEGHDDRKNSNLTTSVIEAHNWYEVVNIIKRLPH